MKLTYIYHSGFAIETEDFTMIIDYYKDTCRKISKKGGYVHDNLLKKTGRMYVLSSHSHGDHYNSEILEWEKQNENIKYILSKDIFELTKTERENIFFLDKGEQYEDEFIKIKAFGSTDIGISFLIEYKGKKLFHAGDLNNWHWKEEASEEEAANSENLYLNELKILSGSVSFIDVVMFPIDPRLGKEYTLGAEQFLEHIKVGLFSPMHFWNRFEPANDFEAYVRSKGSTFVKWNTTGQSIDFGC